jgi:hypothetical protein
MSWQPSAARAGDDPARLSKRPAITGALTELPVEEDLRSSDREVGEAFS